jgi:hypothetical protein
MARRRRLDEGADDSAPKPTKVLVTIGTDTPELLAELNAVHSSDRAGRIRLLATLGALHLQGRLVVPGSAIAPVAPSTSASAAAPPQPDPKEAARKALARQFIRSTTPAQGADSA